MKRLVPLSILLAVVGSALITSPTAANGQSAGLVSSVLNRMERNRQSLKSLKASLSMEKYNAQLRDKDQYIGIIMYMPASGRNASVRIEWQSPQHETLAVANGKYTLFRPRLNMAYTGSSNSRTRQKQRRRNDGHDVYVAAATRSEVSAGSGCSRRNPVGRRQHNSFDARAERQRSFKYAEIWVDCAGMPVQTKIVEKNGDATTMRLSGVERNLKISSDEFNLKLDSNVKDHQGLSSARTNQAWGSEFFDQSPFPFLPDERSQLRLQSRGRLSFDFKFSPNQRLDCRSSSSHHDNAEEQIH